MEGGWSTDPSWWIEPADGLPDCIRESVVQRYSQYATVQVQRRREGEDGDSHEISLCLGFLILPSNPSAY